MFMPLFETTADYLLFFASGNLACQRASESRSPDSSITRRREGGEPFGLRLALVSQEVNPTQGFAIHSQLWSPRPRVVQNCELQAAMPLKNCRQQLHLELDSGCRLVLPIYDLLN